MAIGNGQQEDAISSVVLEPYLMVTRFLELQGSSAWQFCLLSLSNFKQHTS